jgi:hypothetical protein
LFLQPNIHALEERSHIVNAKEILTAIEKGENIYLDNTSIEGTLNLSDLNLPTRKADQSELITYLGYPATKVVKSSIHIKNSIVNGSIYFNDASFDNIINFDNIKFNGNTDFSR